MEAENTGGLVNADGGFVDGWTSGLDIGESKALDGIPDIQTLAKSYVDTKSMVGRSIQIPAEDNAEALMDIYNKLGRPESSDGYSFTPPENTQVNEDLINWFKGAAHEAGLSQSQFEKLASMKLASDLEAGKELTKSQEEAEAKKIEEYNAKVEASKKELTELWKDDTEKKLKNANEAMEMLGLTDVIKELKQENNVELIKKFENVYNITSEDKLENSKETQASREEELKALMKSDSLTKEMHPDHAKAVARFQELHGIK